MIGLDYIADEFDADRLADIVAAQHPIVTALVAEVNDIPIDEAVEKCQDIADDHHRYFDGDSAVLFRKIKPQVTAGGCLT